MTDKERLVELIEESTGVVYGGEYGDEEICPQIDIFDEEIERIADHLIANSVTVQEWISVKDRLPEENGMYIVTANDGHAQRVSFVLWQKRNKAWNLTGARSYWRVTHWQPLPQPPKGE